MDKQSQIDLLRQVSTLENTVDGLVKPEIGVQPIATALMDSATGLRGLWSMASFDQNGDCYDISGQGRTLTYNGNPTYNYDGLAPYIDLDGTGDGLSRGDEAGLDILGTEAYVANPGLTFGGWFWFDRLGSTEQLIGKFGGVGQYSYRIVHASATDTLRAQISVDGTAVVQDASAAITTGKWYHVIARFTPSNEIAIFLSGTKTSTVAAIPASIFNSNASLMIGMDASGTQHLDGRASMCFLCASKLSDSICLNMFQQERVLFGV